VFDAAASRSERERFFVATSEAGASSGASPASIDSSVVAVPFQMLKSEISARFFAWSCAD
jgi:hypothetical protein